MDLLLIFVPPCIALVAVLVSPIISVMVVLALAVALGIILAILFLQTRDMGDGKGDGDQDEAIAEDAINVVREAFAALARSPGATSASFRVVNGTVVHQNSTAGGSNGGDGIADEIRSEEVDSENRDNSGTEGEELESWTELFHAWGMRSTGSSPRSRRGHGGIQRLGRFRVSARRLGGSGNGFSNLL